MSNEFSDDENKAILDIAQRLNNDLASKVELRKMDPEILLRGTILGAAIFQQGFDGADVEDFVSMAAEAGNHAAELTDGEVSK